MGMWLQRPGAQLLEPGKDLQKWAVRKYSKKAIRITCGNKQKAVSHKKIIINMGQGTTGTRWLNSVMRCLGFQTAHNIESIKNVKSWQQWDYISDSPVPFQTWDLVRAYPKALFFLSVRHGE